MHIARERQDEHEDGQYYRICPPGWEEVKVVTEELTEKPVHRDGKETSAADMGGKTLTEESERENQPKGVETYPVKETRLGGAAHSEQKRTETLDNGQSDTTEDKKEEEVHQKEKNRSLDGVLPFCHKEVEEDRIIEETGALRKEEHHLNMSEDDEHEPSEGNA